MKHFTLLAFTIILFSQSCVKDQMTPVPDLDYELHSILSKVAPTRKSQYYIIPDRFDLVNIPQDPKNVLSDAKVSLGNFLFFETGIALDALTENAVGTYSCASCHVPEAGFKPGKAQGIADGGVGFGILGEERVRNINYEEDQMDVQGARPLSMINVAYAENSMWNGSFGSTATNEGLEHLWIDNEEFAGNLEGFHGIEAQNFEGMKTHRLFMDRDVAIDLGYKDLFDQSFPELESDERYTTRSASLAISAYIRTIFPNEAPFQKWLKGENFAMSKDEKEGAILFFDKAGCINCHKTPGLSALEYHALGVNDMYQQPSYATTIDDERNLGRGGYTKLPEDNYKFKVPQLYNLSDTPFFFHGASRTDLKDLVRYFNDAVSENPNVPQSQISPLFQPLDLSDDEINNLTLFLERSLRDPSLARYYPDNILSGNCFPNADFQSRMDLGCN